MTANMLHVYTGNGKGKTTAAMGLALRALGHGKPVLIAQFMKDGTSGELKALKSFSQAHLFQGGRMEGFIWRMTEPQLEALRHDFTRAAGEIKNQMEALRPALTVLDELCVALAVRLLSLEDAMELIEAGLQFGDVAVTGRDAPQRLIDRADYITVMEAVKHPFDEGQQAREGIEW
jgi:cob(I)alamin adenosyltransferase